DNCQWSAWENSNFVLEITSCRRSSHCDAIMDHEMSSQTKETKVVVGENKHAEICLESKRFMKQ
ncbi:unnamed protein product, partial [Musa hybrid cultivar]